MESSRRRTSTYSYTYIRCVYSEDGGGAGAIENTEGRSRVGGVLEGGGATSTNSKH